MNLILLNLKLKILLLIDLIVVLPEDSMIV